MILYRHRYRLAVFSRIAGRLMLAIVAISLSSELYAARYTAIIQGLSGDSYYQRFFDEQSEQLQAAAESVNSDQVQLFQGEEATADAVVNWLKQLGSLGSDDQLVCYYIGHGSYDNKEYKFNLPGPDLSGEQLKSAMEQTQAGYLLLVNTSSASGALLESFADSSIKLITATRSGNERNATRFGRFIGDGVSAAAADLDKNQRISAAELFAYADQQTQDYYQQQGLLATEHAQQQGEALDRLELANLASTATDITDAQLLNLLAERDQLDQQIDALRLARIGMSDDDYLDQYQNLMLKLAVLQTRIDEREESLQ